MRAVGLILFLALIGLVVWLLVGTRLGGGGAPDTELGLAEDHLGTVRAFEAVVEDSLANARRAGRLATELEAAALAAEETADDVAALGDNEAALASARSARLAADDAATAARLMRAYSERMLARFARTDGLANDAEDAALIVETVEESQAEAARAARRAAEARAEMLAAEEALDDASARAGMAAPVRTTPVRAEDDPFADLDEPTDRSAGSIVILNDDPIESGSGMGDDEDVGQRLNDIFPDDVIEYEEQGVPYGERG